MRGGSSWRLFRTERISLRTPLRSRAWSSAAGSLSWNGSTTDSAPNTRRTDRLQAGRRSARRHSIPKPEENSVRRRRNPSLTISSHGLKRLSRRRSLRFRPRCSMQRTRRLICIAFWRTGTSRSRITGRRTRSVRSRSVARTGFSLRRSKEPAPARYSIPSSPRPVPTDLRRKSISQECFPHRPGRLSSRGDSAKFICPAGFALGRRGCLSCGGRGIIWRLPKKQDEEMKMEDGMKPISCHPPKLANGDPINNNRISIKDSHNQGAYIHPLIVRDSI